MKKVCSAVLLLAACLLFNAAIYAATFNINTVADTLDVNPGDGFCSDGAGACSLRAAIGEANAVPGADTITLPPGNYTQTLVAPNDDLNAGGDWDITSGITINGSGEFSCAIQAAASPAVAIERVLNVRPGGDLTLSRVTVRNGNFSGAMNVFTRGAGIENLGSLKLDNVVVRDNQISSNIGDPIGAGIHNAGPTLVLISSSITGNSVTRLSGGGAFGGGVASTSETTITITNGYIGNNNAFANGGSAFGAGLYLEGRFTVNMSGAAVANNRASGTGGTNGSGISAVSNLGPAVFNAVDTTFRNNSGAGSTAGQGIGCYFLTTLTPGASLTAILDRVSVKDNNGASSGVGIGATVNGGPLALNIRNSSVTNNLGGVVGGGIFVTDAGSSFGSRATIRLANTTVSNNVANNSGGGIVLQGTQTTANLDQVTIADNVADNCGGLCSAGGVVNVRNSIFADNAGGSTPDIAGIIISGDYNHFENTTGATIKGTTSHDATGDAMLGPLVEYVGGTVNMPTRTSPVLNTIPVGINGCGKAAPYDQRGAVRPQSGACDKGAVERVTSASITGRVITTDGQGIRNAVVTLSGGNLPAPLRATTSSFGYYQFPDLPGEESYTLTVTTRRFEFSQNLLGLYLIRDTSNLDFVAMPVMQLR